MANWALDALAAAEMVSDIYVVGLSAQILGRSDVRFIEPGDSFIDNLQRGLSAATEDLVLVATADIPFLTAEAVDDFARQAFNSGREFCYSIAPVPLTLERYPHLRRTSAKLKDGEFTGGNLVLLSKAMVQRNADLISHIFEKRKNPIALARVLGFGFMLRLVFASRSISVDALAKHAESIINGTIAVIVTQYPEIATDIDKEEDFEIARRMFEHDARGTTGSAE